MHNIKDIRDNLDNFKKLISKRNVKVETNNISELDKQNRTLIQNKELLEKEKKDISKSKDEALFDKSKQISVSIDKINKQQQQIKSDLDKILSSIPNTPHSDVPNGKDENDNIEINKSGKIPSFDFKPKSHYELGENLGMLDFDLASKSFLILFKSCICII